MSKPRTSWKSPYKKGEVVIFREPFYGRCEDHAVFSKFRGLTSISNYDNEEFAYMVIESPINSGHTKIVSPARLASLTSIQEEDYIMAKLEDRPNMRFEDNNNLR